MSLQNSFTCIRCGNCCRVNGYVRLTNSDIEKISNYLKLDIFSFTNDYTKLTNDRLNLSLIEKNKNDCIFLEGDMTCKINPVKPKQCIDFPKKWNFDGFEQICSGLKKTR